MKKIVVVLVSFVVAVLIGVGNVFAQDGTSNIPNPPLGPEWKLVAIGIGHNLSTVYVDTSRITYLPGGIAKVWTLWVPRGELRRTIVNNLKNNLFLEGKDPNDAEKLWYMISLENFNCKTHQFATLGEFDYSFERVDLYSYFYPFGKWYRVSPGSMGEDIERYVCNGVSPSIPDPPLSSEWKLVAIGHNLSTAYVDTSRITRLPKGIVKVWTLWVPRGELRRKDVNAIKVLLLSEGKDRNDAEQLWYVKFFNKINCKTHQSAILKYIIYSFGKVVLDAGSSQYKKWVDIIPGRVDEAVEKYACKEHK